MRTLRPFAAVALAAVALAACGGSSADPVEVTRSESTATTAAPTLTEAGVTDADAPADLAAMKPVEGLVATARAELAIYTAPGDTDASSTLPAQTEFGSPTTVLVLAENADASWLLVALPVRPNGSTGYVRADDVDRATVALAVDVDLGARRLRVTDVDDATVLETGVAIGSAENPTPTGDYFVTDLLDTGRDSSAYGPYALGLSAHSETLSEFGGGDGQIGIHGTNQPSSIGQAVSHGCVRVPNDIVVQLAQTLPLGTPVHVH